MLSNQLLFIAVLHRSCANKNVRKNWNWVTPVPLFKVASKDSGRPPACDRSGVQEGQPLLVATGRNTGFGNEALAFLHIGKTILPAQSNLQFRFGALFCAA